MRIYERKNRHVRNGKTFVPYNSYTPEDLNKAVVSIREGRMTLNAASKLYKIPKATLSRKWRNLSRHEKAGHPTLFSVTEEKTFINYMKILSEWGFPFDLMDLRVLAQKYLNKIGKKVYSLNDNMPGSDWARNFLLRNKDEISNRTSTNISTNRAKVSPAILDMFFQNWTQTVNGVDPSRIINYDETNLTDDPGNKKYIYKRGVKYPEGVMNSSKTAISLMFSATASGTLLDIYVVYKAEHLWDTWIEGGPKNTHYNRSKSGWFDQVCFDDWFNSVIVPFAKKQNGEKVVLIGDNLSSHFSENVLKSCEELNIAFSCLPPKSTHILQPLDVALFGPLKHYWRKILTDWKELEGRKHKTLVKSCFPKLLKKLHEQLTENDIGSNNIIAGFRKCGLYPVNPEIPLSRLPQSSMIPEEVNSATAEVITDILKEMRGVSAPQLQTRRKKRCQVPPGKSISVGDILPVEPKKSLAQKNSKQAKEARRQARPSIDLTLDTLRMSDENDNLSPVLSDTSTVIDISGLNTYDVSPGPSGFTKKRKSEGENDTGKNKKPKKLLIKTKKGKGVGKKSRTCEKENFIANSQKRAKSSLKKNTRILSSSSTSVTDCMSVHSDSDLLDIFEENFHIDHHFGSMNVFSLNESEESSERLEYAHSISDEKNKDPETESDISDETRNRFEKRNKDPVGERGTSEDARNRPVVINWDPEKLRDKSQEKNKEPGGFSDKTGHEENTVDLNNSPVMTNCFENYEINDHVLVRYYNKKKWAYYIGYVEGIKPGTGSDTCYAIRFYKTLKRPLRFVFTKRPDRDVVPTISIVKKVHLIQGPNNPKEFFISDQENVIYFS